MIERYFIALAAGDMDAVLRTFTRDAYVREPSGEGFRHAGPDGRRGFYTAAFASPGGIPLIHVSATRLGDLFAVEYICDR